MAATESSQQTNGGTNDICYDESVSIKDDKQVTVASKGKNFDECKKQNVTKADCSNKTKAALVGRVTLTMPGSDKPTSISRCQKQPSLMNQNCIALGDSNAARLTSPEFKNACNGGGAYSSDYQCNSDTVDPSHPACQGRTPKTITETIRNLPDGSLEGSKTVLSSGTNDLSQLEICKTDPKSCPIDQSLQEAMKKGASAENGMYCQGVGVDFSYNSIIKDACERNGGTFLGDLPVTKEGNWHATDAGYQGMLDQIGQIAPQDENLFTRDFGGGGDNTTINNTPFKEQGSYDQVRSIVNSACPSGVDCDKFGNNMVATFGVECGGEPNCARVGSSVQGSFQQIPENYNEGIKSYLNTCDQSTDSCQLVGETCVNGAADRMNHICSSAAAVGKHLTVESMIQTQVTDPTKQAAAHMLYQITPGQFDAGKVTDINTFQLSDPARSALCSNKVCLPSGATGEDAINALAANSSVQKNATLANNGTAGAFVGSPTVSKNPIYTNEVRYDSNNKTRVTETIDPKTGEKIYVVSQSQSSNPFGSTGQMMLGNSLGGSLGNLFKGFGTQPTNTTQNQTRNPPPPPATVSITAATSTVKKGENIAVNWTSNATLLSPPCQVTQNGAVISQANAGNRTVTTGSSTPPTLTFILMCKAAQNGQTVQQQTVVNVQ